MASKLYGIDISHWQGYNVIKEQEPSFAIIKATEGKTYHDSMMSAHYKIAKSYNVLTGFYHYARPENNDAIVEADNFLNRIPEEAIGNSIFALDVEGKALTIENIDDWAVRWSQRVENETGVKPLLYVSQSVVKRFPKMCANDNGLWVARYRNHLLGYGDISPWKFAAMWQYTSKPVDRDIFYGNEKQFMKYAARKEK